MPLGQNVTLKDTLIKRTTGKTSKKTKENNTIIKTKIGHPSANPKTDTFGTKKTTFYVKEDLLRRLYNFAYWDRHSLTEAVNKLLEEALKGKNTKDKA